VLRLRAVFGAFCFHLDTLELTKFGTRLALEEKPARLLACLIERRGLLVSRDELRKRLWDEEINIDFDHGLNKAVNKLRSVLGDDANEPRYLETLSRRGYRFIGQVQLESAYTTPGKSSPPLIRNEGVTVANLAQPISSPTALLFDAEPPESIQVPAAAMVQQSVVKTPYSWPLRKLALLFVPAILLTGVLLAGMRRLPTGTEEAPERGNSLPRNVDAARLYSEGMELLKKSNAVDARALLGRAVEIEPQHALSHAGLSRALTELGFSADARTEAERAFTLAGNLPTEQKLLLNAQVSETRFDWDKAIGIYRSLFLLSRQNVQYGLELAHDEMLAGRPVMALETLKQLRQLRLDPTSDLQVDLTEAEAAAAVSDFRHQKELASKAVEKAHGSGDSLLLARAQVSEGEAQHALGNLAEALALWEEATEKFASTGDRSAVVRIRIDEGRVHWQKGELTRAEQSYKEALAASREIRDKASEGRALAGLGQIKMFQIGGPQGRKLCEDALTIFKEIGNRQEEAYTLSLIADTIATHHSEAKKLYEQSLELSREVNDRSRVAGRLMDLGILATVQGDLSTAAQHLQESLRIYREIGERSRAALQLSSLAIVYKWQGRLDEAENLAQQAIAILQEVGETNVRGQVRQNLALIQMEAGKLSEAENSIRLAIAEHRQGNDLGSLSLARSNLAEILVAQGKWAEARDTLEESNKIAHWGQPVGENLASQALTRARLYAARGKFQEAKRDACRASVQAMSMDEGSMYMKALLVSDEIELQNGNGIAGRQRLEQLAREASGKGFGLIADQARKALTIQHAEVRRNTLP
jgi:tetratricopeptide (TPR) repeat protein